MRKKITINIRIRLIASLLSIVIITGISSIIIGYGIINSNILAQAYDVLLRDINTAQYIYENQINSINLMIKHVSTLSYMENAVTHRDSGLILKKISDVKKELNLDILNVTDARGRIIARSRNSRVTGDDVSSDNCVKKVLKTGLPCYGTDIIEREHLMREGPDLVEKTTIIVIPTLRGRSVQKKFEDRAMCLKAAYPIFSDGRCIGVIYGAVILNNNFKIVDLIKSLVFKDEKINGYEIGTVTIFLDDLRISTNVKREDGTRTIGTRVSEEVYNKVFVQQKLWLDKAFVVNNWYISAYVPIYDVNEKAIGILYVGVLDEKYKSIERKTTSYFLLMIILSASVAIILSSYLIRYIIKPINILVDASKEVASGNLSKKINANYEGEIGKLIITFNKMVDAIEERDKMIREQTQKQIVQSEKLASLGRLASGIAHEINNPLTGILTYSSLLKEDLHDSEYIEDLDIIITETLRCRKIVRGILDFARETKLEKQPVQINQIILETLMILEKHVNFQNIRFVKHLGESIPVSNFDVNQMKSVINNLCLNAADAMPDGGELTITTYHDKEKGKIIFQVTDTGIGISEENLGKIFDPFFTTKETGKGTGLGLAVIYGIIERHGGFIDVQSTLGKGTTFTVELPVS
ncbi:MAG TPA: cache domain-containing protein [Spirochaetota bacterium]|nr:cache domain-containing protein [Spirochaetota bacterium]HPI90049.1 cache domain-containing protein [Spirochaetota bacterium]HPR47836.1 cache domain-containing protein [Spirochaetota bacterium]